ncbi:MAG: ATP-dependent helicase/nuclease subunit A, partial [Myxococcota bacterium]
MSVDDTEPATVPVLMDAAARERIRTDIGKTLIVEAAAGTGKTTVLIGRIISLLSSSDDVQLQNIVAVTFTERAAGEMKLRLRTEVERARIAATVPAIRARLDRALYELETSRISTIHALCGDLLRERPIEAGVDPQFDIGADGRTERLYDQAFDRWLREAIAQSETYPGVRRVLRRATFAGGGGSDGPIQSLRSAGWALAERRDYPAAWKTPDYDREASILSLLATLKTLAKMVLQCPDPADTLAQALEPLAQLSHDIDRREALNARYDLDELEAALRGLTKIWGIWRRRGSGRYFAKDLERRAVLDQRESFQSALQQFVASADADVAALLHTEMQSLVERLEARKESAGILGFLDLLLRTRDMLVGDASVRLALQTRFKYVLIDEFQDTNPLQAEILLLLTADDPAETRWEQVRPSPGKLFVVGDPKQSIYRFRRADVALYERIKRRLVAQGAEVLQLQTCFRCRPAIAHAVNAAF